MAILRWKGQSLQLHRYLSGPQSKAARQGILPRYAQLALIIAMAGGRVAALAKKAWREDKPSSLKLAKIQALRAEMNSAFDHFEALLGLSGFETISGVDSDHADQAHANYAQHGNFAMLALSIMEEGAELSAPMLKLAAGGTTLAKVKPQIEDESADLRIYLHVTSEQAEVCSETSTSKKWADVRERYPEEAFQAVGAPPAKKDKAA